MFAVIASTGTDVRPDFMRHTSEALLGGSSNLRAWPDSSAGHSVVRAAVRVPGLLPEDRFDQQPIVSADDDTVFACQVRLDNREDLLRALNLSSVDLADSDILYRCFLKWGRSCMEHLAGDYAFVVFSRRTKELFGATDHAGHTRLFYALAEDCVIVSTQLHTMRCCPYLEPILNEQALGLSAEAIFLKGQTPFRGINALPGGHSLLWSSGTVEVTRWWTPQDAYRARFTNAADYVESALELFEKAVQSCLRTSSIVSATLSGGLDSGLVTGMAAKQLRASGQGLMAYTSAPQIENPSHKRRGWDPDDAPFAAETAGFHENVEHVVLRTDRRTALDLIPQIHARSATPVRNGANHLWIDTIACRLRERGSRVLLTGAHGNFALSYSGLGGFRELCQHLQFRAAFRLALDTQTAGDRAAWKTIAGGLLPQSLFDTLRFRLYGEKLSQSLPGCFLSSTFQAANTEVLRRRRPPQRTRKAFLRGATSPAMLWAADPLPQWNIEFRDPTSDRRLIELLLSFPLSAFSPAGQSRGLAREVGRGLLPDSIRLRRTQGQQSADYGSSMAKQAASYRRIAEEMTDSPACVRLLDLALLQRAIDAVARGETAAVLTGRIDRAVDAGLFLLRQGAGDR